MKQILLIAIFLIVRVFASKNDLDLENLRELFSLWKSEYKVVYEDFEMEEMRFAIFVQNYFIIEEFNSNPEKTSSVALNQFADLTGEEFKAKYSNGLKISEEDLADMYDDDDVVELEEYKKYGEDYFEESYGEIPLGFDWRSKDVISPVKNQGQCGSSYAIAAVDSMDSLYLIENNQTFTNFQEFSIQQVIDCDNNTFGCNGGFTYQVFQYAHNYGLEGANVYPYQQTPGQCKYNASLANKNITDGPGYVKNAIKSSDNLKAAILNQPIVVNIEADQPAVQFYSSGVITSGCGAKVDHAVLAVGFGNNDGTDAFYLKNSWGTYYGNAGYLSVSTNGTINAGLGVCGVLSSPTYPKPYGGSD